MLDKRPLLTRGGLSINIRFSIFAPTNSPVAQSVEQLAVNQRVTCSSHVRGANIDKAWPSVRPFFVLFFRLSFIASPRMDAIVLVQ